MIDIVIFCIDHFGNNIIIFDYLYRDNFAQNMIILPGE